MEKGGGRSKSRERGNEESTSTHMMVNLDMF